MAQVPGLNKNSSAYAESRKATGNDSVSRLINFFNANVGNTEKLASQLQNVVSGQEQKAAQDIGRFEQGIGGFNEAASGVKGLSNLSNLLQSKQGLQGLVGSATNALNPQSSKIDTELLLRDPNALSNLKQKPSESFNKMLDKLNLGLDKAGYQALNKDTFKLKNISPMSKYYEQQSPEDAQEYEYIEEYEGEDAGTPKGSIVDQAMFKAYNLGDKAVKKASQLVKKPSEAINLTEKAAQAPVNLAQDLTKNIPIPGFKAPDIGKLTNVLSDAYSTIKLPDRTDVIRFENADDIFKQAGLQDLGTANVNEYMNKWYDQQLQDYSSQLSKLGLPTDKINETIQKYGQDIIKQVPVIGGMLSSSNLAKVGMNPVAAAGSVATSIGNVIKKLCFAPYTIVKMADGSTKYIDDIQIGDIMFEGGEVYSIQKHSKYCDNIYNYCDTIVTGSHAVHENGKWTRVENSEKGIKLNLKLDYVVSISNTNHLIICNNTVFSDYDEVKYSDDLSLDQCLNILNNKV